MPEPCNDVTVR